MRVIMVNDLFIIDSGAEMRAIPPNLADRLWLNSGFRLQAVYRTSITTYGQRMLKLDLGIRRSFPHVFIVADFLERLNLSFSVRRRCLTDDSNGLSVTGNTTPCSFQSLAHPPLSISLPIHCDVTEVFKLHERNPHP